MPLELNPGNSNLVNWRLDTGSKPAARRHRACWQRSEQGGFWDLAVGLTQRPQFD